MVHDYLGTPAMTTGGGFPEGPEIEKIASRDKSEWHRGRLFFFDSWVDFIKSSCVFFG